VCFLRKLIELNNGAQPIQSMPMTHRKREGRERPISWRRKQDALHDSRISRGGGGREYRFFAAILAVRWAFDQEGKKKKEKEYRGPDRLRLSLTADQLFTKRVVPFSKKKRRKEGFFFWDSAPRVPLFKKEGKKGKRGSRKSPASPAR